MKFQKLKPLVFYVLKARLVRQVDVFHPITAPHRVIRL